MSEIRTDTINNASGDNDSGIDLSTNDQVDIKIANSVKARVDSSGNLLVGTTSTAITTVGIKAKTGGLLQVVRDGDYPLQISRLTSDGEILRFSKSSTTVGSIGVQDSDNLFIASSLGCGLFFQATNILPSDNNGTRQDNSKDLGGVSYRWDDIYATNGTIQTSDRNEKQDIEELSEAEQRVAVVAKGLMRKFRWKDKVAEKGDNARTHFGIIAQDLQDAFTAEGLDAGNYAMFTSDTWTDDDGNEQTRLGVRYNQLLAFIISAL